MTANTESRKRAREDDITDCVPLSKRINNLHLRNSYNNNVICNNTSNLLHQLHYIDADNIEINPSIQHTHSNSLNDSVISQIVSDSTRINGQHLQCHNIPQNQSNLVNTIMESYHPHEYLTCDYPLGEYMPELSPDENPFYYNKNKLLYNLFMERIRRHPDNA